MLETLASIIAGLCAAAAIVQSIFAIVFSRLLVKSEPRPRPIESCGRAAILVPLRGADPRLDDTLRRLANRDHPNYSVIVVVDNERDPAAEVAKRIAQEPNGQRLVVTAIRERRRTCGLQCSALVEAAEQLDESVEDVAIIDGDVVTHESWLRELIGPLADPKIGATFGNRWFASHDAGWGTVVRYLWNVAAIVPMWLFGIPWGGTFAIRRSFIKEAGVLDYWARSMVHDAPTLSMLREKGLGIQFVPSLMMPIGEACSLSFCFDFLKRQMLWTRTYHPNFLPVLVHAVVTSGLAIAAMIASLNAIGQGNWNVVIWMGASLGGYVVAMIGLCAMIDRAVSIVIRRRGENAVTQPWSWWGKLLLAIPLTQLVHTGATVIATFSSRVTWRGVTYHIRSAFDVRLVDDNESTVNAIGQSTSL